MHAVSTHYAVLQTFATSLTEKFTLTISFNPEDQLKGPVAEFVRSIGDSLHLKLNLVTEVRVEGLGARPDMGVSVQSLICGYIELKAPGKGADPSKLRGTDQSQWEKFKNLPNLLYTDGNEWALYRNGERVGKMVRMSGDVTSEGKKAVDARNADDLLELLREFLHWQPISPRSPQELARLIAPLCRLLRADVIEMLQVSSSNLSSLAHDWRQYLFPDADDYEFADAYAQTLTYALLLARLSEPGSLSISSAVSKLKNGHALLSQALKILSDDAAHQEIAVPVDLLERLIASVDPNILTTDDLHDPWLYFYEDFLAVYDPKMRNNRGVYYTPVPVVQTQVRLVAQLLADHFDADFSYADPRVVTLDPAAGTGTYILAAFNHSLEQTSRAKGPGMRKNAATQAAQNLHGFEILVGPYAVCHLRLTQQILAEGGAMPEDGVHVYLTDTLDSPKAVPPQYPMLYRQLGEEHQRAQKVKAQTPILVCMGNPPYDRQQIEAVDEGKQRRKGGWIRFGDEGVDGRGILQDFLDPKNELGVGVHAKNLYNDYVYFWRWALWKVFEDKSSPGIVSYITAASYLRGPGFAAMRRLMRQIFDELWIIDLEGDNLGARKTENVFDIQTPVCIAIGVRYGPPQPEQPAAAHYCRIEGTREEKFEALLRVQSFTDLAWRDCLPGWADPLLPTSASRYWEWPLLTDIFPWQENGMQFKRTWPISESLEVLQRRWETFLNASNRKVAFKESRDRRITGRYPKLDDSGSKDTPLANLSAGSPCPQPSRIAYRSFDRQWALVDNRLGDYLRPSLHNGHSQRQVYLTSLLTNVLGEGPAAVVTALIPDLDHFRGSFGAKHVIPLWKDRQASAANLPAGLLEQLAAAYGAKVGAEDVFAYTYALLASPRYAQRFWEELTIPGPRLPLTRDAALFAQVAALGRQLLWLHTYGERFVPLGKKPGKLPAGTARCKVGTPSAPEDYPEKFSYDEATQELHVGKGIFEKVRPEVWNFSVSGLQVVKSWLGYRMRERSGKKSSPLDEIRPQVWSFDDELLELLWVLDATVDLLPQAAEMLDKVLASPLIPASELPQPTPAERKGAPNTADMPLLDFTHRLDEEDESPE